MELGDGLALVGGIFPLGTSGIGVESEVWCGLGLWLIAVLVLLRFRHSLCWRVSLATVFQLLYRLCKSFNLSPPCIGWEPVLVFEERFSCLPNGLSVNNRRVLRDAGEWEHVC